MAERIAAFGAAAWRPPDHPRPPLPDHAGDPLAKTTLRWVWGHADATEAPGGPPGGVERLAGWDEMRKTTPPDRYSVPSITTPRAITESSTSENDRLQEEPMPVDGDGGR